MISSTSAILITIDVEDWFQVENFKPWIPFSTWSLRELRVEKNTHKLLDLFDSIKLKNSTNPIKSSNSKNLCYPKATFFMLGWVAERLPNLVREIHKRGHEIASHGYDHDLCNEKSEQDLKEDLTASRKFLEDIIGEPVLGYRAPSFSINEKVLDIIKDSGYLYDSSYNSFDKHDRYGHVDFSMKTAKGIAFLIHERFYELPVSNIKMGRKIIPWGGGGYFRLIPFPLFRIGVQNILKRDAAYVFYLHPWEIDPHQPRVKDASSFFRFRHYVNLKTTITKLEKMLYDFDTCNFITCKQYIEGIERGKNGD